MAMAMTKSPISSVPLVLAALVVILGLRLLVSLLRSYFLRPWSAYRALARQGFHVLPYSAIAGNLVELKRMEMQAQSSPIPSPSHHHHLLFDRICPFINKHMSAYGHRDDAPLVYWWGNTATVVITQPEDAKCALMADVKHFKAVDMVVQSFLPLLGNGLLLADEATWRHHRSTLQPAFFAEKLKEMVIHMTASAMEMVDGWKKQLTEQGFPLEMEVAKPIKDTSADILSRSFFGSSYLQGREVFEMQVELLGLLAKLRVQNSIIPGYKYFPTKLNRRCAILQRRIRRQLSELVEARRQRIRIEGGVYGSDLLGLMLEDEGKAGGSGGPRRFTTQQIVDECRTFFFAGHETTAGLLAWTMVLLSVHQEWQDRARREVLEACGGDAEALDPNALSKLKLVSMVLTETLRLYPPVPELGRRSMKPDEKGFQLGSRSLPPGTDIVVECLYIHRRKDIWGDDADEFKPERFSGGVASACRHPFGFIPFGIGPRNCVGQHFALLEARVILALVLAHFRFRLSPDYRHAPLNLLTLRPRLGVQVLLEPV